MPGYRNPGPDNHQPTATGLRIGSTITTHSQEGFETHTGQSYCHSEQYQEDESASIIMILCY